MFIGGQSGLQGRTGGRLVQLKPGLRLDTLRRFRQPGDAVVVRRRQALQPVQPHRVRLRWTRRSLRSVHLGDRMRRRLGRTVPNYRVNTKSYAGLKRRHFVGRNFRNFYKHRKSHKILRVTPLITVFQTFSALIDLFPQVSRKRYNYIIPH